MCVWGVNNPRAQVCVFLGGGRGLEDPGPVHLSFLAHESAHPIAILCSALGPRADGHSRRGGGSPK